MKKSFTMIELLIVLVIIVIIVTLAIPKFRSSDTLAKVAEAKSILGQLMDIAIFDMKQYGGNGSIDGHFYLITDPWPDTYPMKKPISKYWNYELGYGNDVAATAKQFRGRYAVNYFINGANIDNIFRLEVTYYQPDMFKPEIIGKWYRVWWYDSSNQQKASPWLKEWPL